MKKGNLRSKITLWSAVLLAGLLAIGVLLNKTLAHTPSHKMTAPGSAPPFLPATADSAVPLLAYFYIWFDLHAWDRAKSDYPAIGRYSSDDPAVMRRQMEEAKSAGIDGFIVSWKNTRTDDRRLRLLVAMALAEHFKLAIIYEGLDFQRRPLPVSEVAAAFKMFSDTYASNPAFFRLGGKPLTIWSGTWAYSHAAVASVTRQVRRKVLVLNTEKNVRGFLRLADVTDGDAYYWSSVNPATNTDYALKLGEMSQVIHQHGEYWLAPFAPGFDAKLVGGTSVVTRGNGQTLRTEYSTALASSPDIIGLISWNEFSENTYVEPSVKYSSRYLAVLRQLRRTPVPQPTSATDSSAGRASGRGSYWPSTLRLGAFVVALVLGVGAIGYFRRRAAMDAVGKGKT